MTKTIDNNSEIHALTVAEIGRQISALSERRRQIVDERGKNYHASMKSGVVAPVISPDEAAAREHARLLLNGATPEFSALPQAIDPENMLWREQRGIDIALKILSDKHLVERAAEAVVWAEANREKWRSICREITLTAVKLEALERSARELMGQCVDIFAVRLPMANIIGGRPISDTPIIELAEVALREGVVSAPEIRKAENV